MTADAVGVGRRAAPTRRRTVPLAAEDLELQAALAAVERARERPYFDEQADGAERERYYRGLAAAATGAELYRALSALLEATHGPQPAYKPTRLVYPWVDLHPDGLLRSIYSGETFTAEELVRADLEAERARSERLIGVVRDGVALGPRELEAEFDALERELPFNCEHVVPQSWFSKREPMRGDLHHLFACESRCNSFRGNWPYFDFDQRRRALREDCGRLEAEGFQPVGRAGPGRPRHALLPAALPAPGGRQRARAHRRAARAAAALARERSGERLRAPPQRRDP